MNAGKDFSFLLHEFSSNVENCTLNNGQTRIANKWNCSFKCKTNITILTQSSFHIMIYQIRNALIHLKAFYSNSSRNNEKEKKTNLWIVCFSSFCIIYWRLFLVLNIRICFQSAIRYIVVVAIIENTFL